jgi:hypothetical protein
VKAFTVLSYENINTFIKDNFDKINSDFSEPDNLVEKLYMRFTQEIFERK